MPELDELYQELILDHAKRPRNFRVPEGADRRAEGFNRLCGDRITLFLRLEDGVVRDAGFQGAGCAIFTASASLLTEAVKGKSEQQAEDLFRRFHALVTGHPDQAQAETLGKLAAFGGVSAYPVRVKCASLAWHTLKAALSGNGAPVSTEE
jgi:nitrogen fixation NifU-like protein